MYLFEASISLGTSVTTVSRIHSVDVVLSSPDPRFRTEAQPLPHSGNVGGSQLGPLWLLLAKDSPLAQRHHLPSLGEGHMQ